MQGEAKAGHFLWHRALPDEEGHGVWGFGGRSFHRGSPDATGEEHSGHGGPLASRDGFASMKCRAEAKAEHPLWHRALPDEESLGGAGAVGVRFIGEAPMPRGRSTRGLDGFQPAGVASPASSAGESQSGAPLVASGLAR